jgi:outer membrane immunogenic protein
VAPIGYNWTGCYVDGGGGYGLFNQDSFTTDDGGGSTSKVTNGGRGWFGTVGGGCDVQFGRWVVGAFGNYDFADLKGDVVIPASNAVGREKQDSAWAVGGRLGYTLTPTILTYLNAGYTQARFSGIDLFSQSSGTPADLNIGAHTYSGWFLGSGFEYNLGFMPGLFWKTEYRFAQYNRDTLPILDNGGAPTGNSLASDKTIQTIRSELVWRFNWSGGRY